MEYGCLMGRYPGSMALYAEERTLTSVITFLRAPPTSKPIERLLWAVPSME